MAGATRKVKKNAHGKPRVRGPARRKSPAVSVGKPWTVDDIAVVDHDRRARTSAAIGLGALFSVMLAGFGLYAFAAGDADLQNKVFTLVQVGVFGVMAWAFGPRLFRLISGIRFDDPDDRQRDEEYKN